jgi:hypothetical protein
MGPQNCRSPFDFAQGRLSASLGMTRGREELPGASGGWLREPQVPPLRFAPVGMTIHIVVRDASTQEKLLSRKKSQTLGMTKGRVVLPGASVGWWSEVQVGGDFRRANFTESQALAVRLRIATSGGKFTTVNQYSVNDRMISENRSKSTGLTI